MNEEQAVLDFFLQEENRPLALIAAQHLDELRQRLNNEFWAAARDGLDALVYEKALPWKSVLIEDKNSEDCLLGLYLQPASEQRVFLRPFMEQQFIGNSFRVYFGLMWSQSPEPAQQGLEAVRLLQQGLEARGFKQSEHLFAWQWLAWHPRRRDFLMRFSRQRQDLLDESLQLWKSLLIEHGELLNSANQALAAAPRSVAVSLDQLRSSLKSTPRA